jgi:2,3-bisphosphoglycerate-dependent phosphoglycerate mutase
MSVFYLVRHAHAEWEPDENRSISTRGQVDAIRAAEVLSSYEITRIYSSPFRRAKQTITPLADRLNLPIHIEPDLRERKLSEHQVGEFFQAVEMTWRDPSFHHPGGESNTTAQQRGVAVILRSQAQHPDEHVALSTHGNLLALVLQHFEPSIDYDFWKNLTMPDIYRLNLGEEGEEMITRLWGDAA